MNLSWSAPSPGIEKKHLKLFTKETEDLLHRRVTALLWLGIVFFPLFSILDFVMAREHFILFGQYRGFFSLLMAGFLLLHHKKLISSFLIAITFCTIGSFILVLMILKIGHSGHFYYVGPLLILVGYFAVLPLHFFQAIFSGIILLLIYTVPCYLDPFTFLKTSPENFKIFFNNTFFLFAFAVVGIVQCHEELKGRVREFNLKIKLKKLTGELSYYTHHLEEEVEKQLKEIEESELRYKKLYDNILDPVILLDHDGTILMANPHFYNFLKKRREDVAGMSFFDFVDDEDVARVKQDLLAGLMSGLDIKDFQFKMLDRNQKKADIECNAKTIDKDGQFIGYQLVARDITRRNEMKSELVHSQKEINTSRTAAIFGLAKLVESRDHETGNHLERIREYTKIICEELAGYPEYANIISQDYTDDLYLSSILHDIGKVGIPDAILLKPGKLTPEEFNIMKFHSIIGGDALKDLESRIKGKTFLTIGREVAYYHHERWDGSGYPQGLKNSEIPLSAAIVALADVYDALTSKRCYKPSMTHEEARKIIFAEKGKHFAPSVVEAFAVQEHVFKKTRMSILVQ